MFSVTKGIYSLYFHDSKCVITIYMSPISMVVNYNWHLRLVCALSFDLRTQELFFILTTKLVESLKNKKKSVSVLLPANYDHLALIYIQLLKKLVFYLFIYFVSKIIDPTTNCSISFFFYIFISFSYIVSLYFYIFDFISNLIDSKKSQNHQIPCLLS